MVEWIAGVIGLAMEFCLWPFRALLPGWQLVIISALVGLLLVIVYGRVSFQNRLKLVKRRITSLILEAVLFRHDLRVSLGAQARLLREAAVYLGLAVPPLLVLAVPSILILGQLNLRFGLRPLGVGEPAILEATVTGGLPFEAISLSVPQGVSVTPPVRDSTNRTVSWRVTGKDPGVYDLTMRLGEQGTFSQTFAVGSDGPVAPVVSKRWWERLMFPAPHSLSGTLPLSRVELTYPDRTLSIFGRSMNWLVLFFIVSLASGLVGSRVFGIEV